MEIVGVQYTKNLIVERKSGQNYQSKEEKYSVESYSLAKSEFLE